MAMRIRKRLRFIGAIVATIAGLLIITGCSAEKKQISKQPIKESTITPVSYNLSKAPSREQWTSKKTGNLVVIFTTKDSLAETPGVQDQSLKCQLIISKNKKNVITKTFYEDNFGAVQLIPGSYSIKNVLQSTSTDSDSSISKLNIKAGETVVLWNYVNTSKSKPLVTKTRILDDKLSQYVHSIVSSRNKLQRLDPRTCFAIAPAGKANEEKAIASVKELTLEKGSIAKEKEKLNARLAELKKNKLQVSKTIPALQKSVNSARAEINTAEIQIKESVKHLTQLGDTLEALDMKKESAREKLNQLGKWKERSSQSDSTKDAAIAKLKQQESKIQKTIDSAKKQVDLLTSKLQSKQKSKDELTKQQDKLVAEQTVLTNIRTKLAADKVLAEGKVSSIDKAIQAEKENKKQAVELMKTLLAGDQLADDKLAGINKKIKDIYNNIKTREAERPEALKTVKTAEKKLQDNQKKLQEVSTGALTYLKNIELAKRSVEETHLELNAAKLKLKDHLLDKKLIESKVAQAIELSSKNTGEKDEIENELKKLKAKIAAIDKQENEEGNKLPALQTAVNAAKRKLQSAEKKSKVCQSKLTMTEASIRELTEAEDSIKEKLEDLDDKSAYLDAKIKMSESNALLAKENVDYRSQKRTLNMMIAELRNTKSLLEGKVKFEKMNLSKSHEQLKKYKVEIKALEDKLKVAQNNTKLEKENTTKVESKIKKLEVEKAKLIAQANTLRKTIEDAKKTSSSDKATLAKKDKDYKKVVSDKDELVRQLGLASKKSQEDLARLEAAFKKEKELTDKINVLESQLNAATDEVKKSKADTKFSESNLSLASKLAQDLKLKQRELEKRLKDSEAKLAASKDSLITMRSKSASESSQIRILTAKLDREVAVQNRTKKEMQKSKAKYDAEIATALETIKGLSTKLSISEQASKNASKSSQLSASKAREVEIEKVRLAAELKQLSDKARVDKEFMNNELEKLKNEFKNAFEQKKKHQTALKSAFDKIDALTTEKSKLEATLDEAEKKYNLAFDEKRKQQLLATDIKEKMRTLAAEKEKLESEFAVSNEKLELQKKSMDQSGNLSAELKDQRDELKEDILKLREKIKDKDGEIAATTKESRRQLKLNEAQANEIAELKTQVLNTSNKLAEAREEIDKMRSAQKQIEDRLRFADDKIMIEKKSKSQASELAEELKTQRDKQNKEIKQLKDSLEQLRKETQDQTIEAKKSVAIITKKLADKEKELGFKISTIDRLKSKEKELITEVEKLKKSAKIKDHLLLKFSRRLKDQREMEKIPSYRSIPTR